MDCVVGDPREVRSLDSNDSSEEFEVGSIDAEEVFIGEGKGFQPINEDGDESGLENPDLGAVW